MGSVHGFLYQKMFLFDGSFWVSVSTLFLALFGLFSKFLYRAQVDESSCENNQVESKPMKPEAEFEVPKPEKTENDYEEKEEEEEEEEETPNFIFKFEFQTCKELNEINKEKLDSVPSTSTNKYEFKPEKHLSGFIEEPEDVRFTVKELFSDSNEEEKESSCMVLKEKVGSGDDFQFLSEDDFVAVDSDSDSITSSNEFSVDDDGFFSDKDCKNEVEDSHIMEELQELEESNFIINSSIQMLSDQNESKSEEFGGKVSKKSNLQDSEDANGLETLWEHQDLIEQLKMEIKKVRAIGLPTILEEESESPKIMEHLKPWKIDDKFNHEDTLGELHKFYKSYRERMRKFDILNYQKMYAIGFLQSKDPLHSISSLKSSTPGMTSLFPQNFLLSKRKKSESDPMKKFIRELHSDLEVVYVGQVCLSWEILHWQYDKSLELWESDPYGIRRYNEVAGEFQQFEVLMQRFIENEAFEGPRVQNYIKNRCVLRNLLQVPVIREDNLKDRKKARTKGRDNYAITSDMLVEIMEESIRIFWRFVRADNKDTNIAIQKSRKGTQIEPQDTLDLELLSEVRTCLQKKEKKLKDILRSGKCILRKFQKQEDSSDQVLYFFSQVDMKLVARVLQMSKITTDQLLWCRNKLSKINFVSRKIHVEPSFLLFPC
ncbi:hypothetical protein Ddye_008147 [Dipteronia dyeriana]|uniref:Ribosomal protein L34Ae n=1 Tax=Dipteronia dyeriana TaxID=168575 RepID=A0AAD9X8Y7_9ROSI|nr:hypothetical protein Ddye_008147 [Dipteronia dyeriana]